VSHYWLDCLGFEPQGGGDVPYLPRPVSRPMQPPMHWVTSLFPGVKQLGCGVDRPIPSSVNVKERVERYICAPPPVPYGML